MIYKNRTTDLQNRTTAIYKNRTTDLQKVDNKKSVVKVIHFLIKYVNYLICKEIYMFSSIFVFVVCSFNYIISYTYVL